MRVLQPHAGYFSYGAAPIASGPDNSSIGKLASFFAIRTIKSLRKTRGNPRFPANKTNALRDAFRFLSLCAETSYVSDTGRRTAPARRPSRYARSG